MLKKFFVKLGLSQKLQEATHPFSSSNAFTGLA